MSSSELKSGELVSPLSDWRVTGVLQSGDEAGEWRVTGVWHNGDEDTDR